MLGDRWTLLILRESFYGRSRFAEFRAALDISSDVLSRRLSLLVDGGVLAKVPYRVPGQRVRFAYLLTHAGHELHHVLGALQQWGDHYLPRPGGPTTQRRSGRTGRPLRVAFLDDLGREVEPENVVAHRTVHWVLP
ncbi:HxlR family transcriptional regulator [Lentzea cavernae]|uniref:HxlR family transcriptional regulator n=1 Tax=Lentzea cavernae TaxID=2020703 RepID=A0ABQ3M5R4_9PSEU|nr:HxlR family transcriptional regulator [Lentzea cavernae]